MATSTLHFRTATPADAEPLQQLVQAAFRAADSRQDWTGNAELASHFRVDVADVVAKLADPDIVTLVAFSDSTSSALVASIEVAKRGAGCGRLSMIAVDARHQRGGVGRQVLAHAEAYCRRTWGAERFSLNALSTRGALVEWYVRRGYRRTGETTPFPRERFAGLALPEDMCFVELEKDFSDVPEVDQSA